MISESGCGAYTSGAKQLPTGEWDITINCAVAKCPLKYDDVPQIRRISGGKNEKEARALGVRITNYICPIAVAKWFPKS